MKNLIRISTLLLLVLTIASSSQAQKTKSNTRDHRLVRDHRVPTRPGTTTRPTTTPRPANKYPGRYDLPDSYRPQFEQVAVWSLQLKVKTSRIKNADSDSKLQVQFRSNESSKYYLNNGGNDREKGNTDIYEILDPNIRTIGDIQFMRFMILGKDKWCVEKIELIVNGSPIPVFEKVYPGGRCIDMNSGSGPNLHVRGTVLRNSPTWKHSKSNKAIWLPPSIIKRATLEKMVESYVGHMMYADPNMKSKDLTYGYKHGKRYVEATKKAKNKLHFDLDLKSHYGIDFEVDVDFDLVIACKNNKLSLSAESVKGEADIPILSSILDVFGSSLHKMNMGNFSFGNANLPFCPRVKVTNAGDVTLSL